MRLTDQQRSIVQDNLGLVIHMWSKIRSDMDTDSFSISFDEIEDDALQNGRYALMSSARCFDPERNTKFSTYACIAIRNAILRTIADYKHGCVRVPWTQTLDEEDTLLRYCDVDNAEDMPIDDPLVDVRIDLEMIRCTYERMNSPYPEVMAAIFVDGDTMTSIGRDFGISVEVVTHLRDEAIRFVRQQLASSPV